MESNAPDPFTMEIVKNALIALGDEMFYALQRTSKSPIIYETLDYAVGATDARGHLIAQGNGVTGFLGTLDGAVLSVLQKFGADKVRPGDVFVTNDPYEGGGTHLSDVSLVMPIFYEDEVVAFVANKAHWTEVGGKDPGSWTTDATEVYQEGLQFPNVRLFDQGEPNQALLDLISANVRLPDMTLGDLWAGVAALRVGERRFVDLCRRYGKGTILDAMENLLDHGEQMTRLELAKLPRGVFEAEDWIDDDGIGNGPFPVRIKVTISENEFVCDFTGSHSQVPGPINCTRSGLVSEVRAGFKAVTAPHLPTSGGMFRPLNIVCPPNTIFTAERPAPVSTYWETKRYAVDLLWKALAPHVPHRLPAGHFLSVCGTVLSGSHPDTGEFFLLVEPLVGGWEPARTRTERTASSASATGRHTTSPSRLRRRGTACWSIVTPSTTKTAAQANIAGVEAWCWTTASSRTKPSLPRPSDAISSLPGGWPAAREAPATTSRSCARTGARKSLVRWRACASQRTTSCAW
jgi:N-methylhydantoinase B